MEMNRRGKSMLPMLAALATHLQRLPESARDLVSQPRLVTDAKETRQAQTAARRAQMHNLAMATGLNRKARRRLAAQVRRP